jgi:hypothetical protein
MYSLGNISTGWRRWISLDWGFEHPAAVYWHAAMPGVEAGEGEANRIVTYRQYVTHRTPPRELAREIIARGIGTNARRQKDPSGLYSGPQDDAVGEGAEREKVVYLSPDAFARRTDEASIAEQMGDVFAGAGLPRPVPADDDRVGGWILMYQMVDAGEWVLTENCIELIRTRPNLVRDPARIEDIEKMDGDDSADAARYGLKSRYAVHRGGERRMPLANYEHSRNLAADYPDALQGCAGRRKRPTTAETERLRAENRALLNSILGIAGVPPSPTDLLTSCSEPPRITHPAPRPGLEAPPSGPGTSSRGRQGRLADGGFM